ncbi:MAG TPA: Mur ligase family protein [Candidatus Binataceae bacterium]|nr:Mur ligase family protein [Candidatus Binataceae bacterium]
MASESEARLARIPLEVRHVHLVGVAGTAMAALALMLAERGYRVTGSDSQFYEPTASLLKNSRVELMRGFAAGNLKPAPELAVIGNVVQRINPEAAALLESPIPYLSMPEALWHFFLKDRRVLMVAGTHGKTTSTALMAQTLTAMKRDPSLLVGGVAKDFDSNFRLGAGEDFVIEGDEYDTAFFDKGPKFLHYHPRGAIITSVEFDHADIYRDLEHVKSSFRALAEQMDPSRVLAVCADYPHALDVTAHTGARRVTYGLDAGQYRATGIRADSAGSHFEVSRDGATLARDVLMPTGGRMNVANALGVFALLCELGLSAKEIARGIATFRGVVRRQEVIGEAGGVTVIDDFAHHPTAIRVTLEALAERFAGRRILAAFEPRSNTSRRNVFQDSFGAAFEHATRVYLGPVFFKETVPVPAEDRLNTAKLADTIRLRGAEAFACSSSDEILERMTSDARPGDVAVFMSNGPFDNLKERFLERMRERA